MSLSGGTGHGGKTLDVEPPRTTPDSETAEEGRVRPGVARVGPQTKGSWVTRVGGLRVRESQDPPLKKS